MSEFYQVVEICSGLVLATNLESPKAAFKWCKENSWVPARFENDPEANVVVQHLELVTSPATVKPNEISDDARQIQASILEQLPPNQRNVAEVRAQALAIAQLWETDPPEARKIEKNFIATFKQSMSA